MLSPDKNLLQRASDGSHWIRAETAINLVRVWVVLGAIAGATVGAGLVLLLR